MKVPPGAIPERKPRPLTPEERKRLGGGEVKPEDLEGLAAKFAKPERIKPLRSDGTSKSTNNGWGR